MNQIEIVEVINNIGPKGDTGPPGPSGLAGAPFDAMAYSGMQINGLMEVSQEFGIANTVVNNTTKYAVDGFGAALLAAGATGATAQSAISDLPGFNYALALQSTSGMALGAAGDAQSIYQYIEGYRWARLAFGTSSAQPVTIAFWVKPNIAGTMAVSLRLGTSRSYVAEVPITSGVWQYKSVTIPGDVTGIWPTTNASAVTLSFCFGAGTGWRAATANTWVATQSISTASTTNFFISPGTLYLTGVVVLPGTQAPTAAQSPLIMRPYDQELLTCQRYYYKRNYTNIGAWITTLQAYSTTAASGPLCDFPATMRAAPTAASAGGFQMSNTNGGALPLTGGTFSTTTDFAMLQGAAVASGLIAGNATLLGITALPASHTFDARL